MPKMLLAGCLSLVASRKFLPYNTAAYDNNSQVQQIFDTGIELMQPKKPGPMFYERAMIIAGSANQPLANEVCDILGVKLGNVKALRFADGEVNLKVVDGVRGKDIFIIQPTCPPVNDNLIELLLMISTLKRMSARTITAVIPYYGYSRQDVAKGKNVALAAADVALYLEKMGVDRVIGIDLHNGQLQGAFSPKVPVDNLEAFTTLFQYLMKQKDTLDVANLAIVSPDAAGVLRAKVFQQMLRVRGYPDTSLAMIVKHKQTKRQSTSLHLIGTVQDSDVIIVDDMIDTGATICDAVYELKKHGAKSIYAFATHGIFNGKAFERIKKAPLEKLIVTNTVPVRGFAEKDCGKIERLTIAPLIAEVIRRVHENETISQLFDRT